MEATTNTPTRTSAPRNLHNKNVGVGTEINGELRYRDLANKAISDNEELTDVSLFAHVTTEQVGLFLTALSTKGFKQAFTILMTNDKWKDSDQVELLFAINKECCALLSQMTMNVTKQQAYQRLRSTCDEYFRPTLNSKV